LVFIAGFKDNYLQNILLILHIIFHPIATKTKNIFQVSH